MDITSHKLKNKIILFYFQMGPIAFSLEQDLTCTIYLFNQSESSSKRFWFLPFTFLNMINILDPCFSTLFWRLFISFFTWKNIFQNPFVLIHLYTHVEQWYLYTSVITHSAGILIFFETDYIIYFCISLFRHIA